MASDCIDMSPDSFPDTDLHQRLDQISAQLQRIQAHLVLKPATPHSPLLPLPEAAKALHFTSANALRSAIQRGKIPAQFLSWTTGAQGKRRRYLVDVEGYISHLRHQGRH